VTELGSLTLSGGSFDAAKLVDATSPALQQAEVTATPFSTTSLLFYDSLTTDTQPDAQLVLHTTLVTSIQPQVVGGNPGELVSFSFASPSVSLFLELPGVSGESSAPGHPGVIALDSFTLSGSGFAVHKVVDSTSTALQTAELLAHAYATATLLVYSNVLTQSQPDFELVYQQALVSSIATQSLGQRPTEDVTFATTGVTVTPEPAQAELALVALGALLATRAARRTRAGAR
jgi:type VI protein secretion system component Hcp